MNTRIEWADRVWNPITGCTPVSPGCEHCYARRMAYRLRGRCGYPADEPFRVTLHPERLDEPVQWRKPVRVFLCSMGDIFHEDVPDRWIDYVFARMVHPMWGASRHTYLILTKRPERILRGHVGRFAEWPNIWLGVTVENPDYLWRLDILQQIPAAVRFVSVEPMLGPVNLGRLVSFKSGFSSPDFQEHMLGRRRLDWVVCGGETGPGARPMPPEWPRSLRDQCIAADVPFFFKQFGEWSPIGNASMHKYQDVPIGDNTHHRMFRVGKKAAGRLLDGQEWNQFPEVRQP